MAKDGQGESGGSIERSRVEREASGVDGSRLTEAAALFREDATVRRLLESLAEAVVVIDSEGRIVLANPRVEKIFGYHPDELIGRPLGVLIPKKYRQVHERHVSGYFEDPRIRPMGSGLDLQGLRRDGEVFPVEISLSYLDTAHGTLALAFVTDVSERVSAETQLKRRNEELDAFAHTVAHDLKNSATLLVGYAEMLLSARKPVDAEELEDALGTIREGGLKMASIIDNLLLLTKVGKEEMERVPLDMVDLIASALQRLKMEIEASGARIELDEELPAALGHGPWVEEVWLNYLSNALRYGGSQPLIRIGGEKRPDGYVRFWVDDQGPGIPDKRQRGLFDSSGADIGCSKGHGLGLSIVRRIVQRLDGQVGVESEEGKGSRFYFELPGPD